MISSDGPVPVAAQWKQTAEKVAQIGRLSGNEVWLIDTVPADLAKMADPLTGRLPPGNQPTPGGIIVRIARYEPGLVFPMHATWTVDLGIVISGSLELKLEEASTVLGPGDIVVQRGTPHSWRVVGDQACVVAFVLVDATHGQGARPAS
jgi:quercetin dioxygenase-like cupin family protein